MHGGDFGVRPLLVLGASGCSRGCAEDSSSVSQRVLELPWPPDRAGCNGNISKFFWMRKIPQAAPLQRKFGMAEMFGVRGCLLLFTLNSNIGGGSGVGGVNNTQTKQKGKKRDNRSL